MFTKIKENYVFSFAIKCVIQWEQTGFESRRVNFQKKAKRKQLAGLHLKKWFNYILSAKIVA